MKTATIKTKTVFSFLFLLLLTVGSVHAQSPTILMNDTIVGGAPFCPTPQAASLLVRGGTVGFNIATDSVIFAINWGDGNATFDTVNMDTNYYGSTIDQGAVTGTYHQVFQGQYTHTYSTLGTYTVQVVATVPSGAMDTLYLPTVSVTSTCNTLSGYTYRDLNSNCMMDSGEDSLAHRAVVVRDANGTFINSGHSNTSGYYSFSVPTNLVNAVAKVSTGYGDSTNCPSSGEFIFNSSTSQTNNFSLDCFSTLHDVSVGGYSLVGPPGGTGTIHLTARRVSCGYTSLSDTLMLVLDSAVSYQSVLQGPSPSSINGDTLYWYFTHPAGNATLSSRVGLYVQISISTSTSANLNDTTFFHASCRVPSNDPYVFDNTDNWWCLIGAPYDPNNKLATPQGVGPEGKIDTSIHRLSYRVNFQNTGSAPAQNVLVLDTLPLELNPISLQYLESSHPDMNIEILEDHVVRFNWQNINLPDSASDPEGSKGFVTFQILRWDSLGVGTVIKNRVGIYFDYQPVVMTDYAINTLYVSPDDPDSLVIQVNPSDVTCIENDNGSIQLDVLSGNAPYTYGWSNGSTTKNIEELSPASYTVTVTDSEQLTAEATVVVGENRIHPAPIVGLINGPESVEAWKPYTYNILLNTGSAYNWMVDGGEVVDQANNQAEILWYGGPEGTITAIEKDLNGCTAQRDKVIPIEFVGIAEGAWKDLLVYPNPTKHSLNVQLPEGIQSAKLHLHDAQGRLVRTETMNSNKTTMNVEQLSHGVYWLDVIQGEFQTKVKVVVNK